MCNALRVHVGESRANLMHIAARHVVVEAALRANVAQQIAIGRHLHHHEDLVVDFDDLVRLNDIRMPQLRRNDNLARHEALAKLGRRLGARHDFDGDREAIALPVARLDFGKRALACCCRRRVRFASMFILWIRREIV